MTKTDLFRIIIKVLGLYLLGTIVYYMPSALILLWQTSTLLSVLLSAAIVLLLIALFISFIFRPDFYIRLFRLDKGFDNDLSEKMSCSFEDLLKIVIITFGLWLIVKHLPMFVTKFIFLLKLLIKDRSGIEWQLQNSYLTDYVDWGNRIFGLIIGFLMITKFGQIAAFIFKKDINLKTDNENGR